MFFKVHGELRHAHQGIRERLEQPEGSVGQSLRTDLPSNTGPFVQKRAAMPWLSCYTVLRGRRRMNGHDA